MSSLNQVVKFLWTQGGQQLLKERTWTSSVRQDYLQLMLNVSFVFQTEQDGGNCVTMCLVEVSKRLLCGLVFLTK